MRNLLLLIKAYLLILLVWIPSILEGQILSDSLRIETLQTSEGNKQFLCEAIESLKITQLFIEKGVKADSVIIAIEAENRLNKVLIESQKQVIQKQGNSLQTLRQALFNSENLLQSSRADLSLLQKDYLRLEGEYKEVKQKNKTLWMALGTATAALGAVVFLIL